MAGSVLDALSGWRNRLIASPKFQRWAFGFVFAKPMAQKRAMALFDLCAGFVYSQTLFACVELGLFRLLQPGPLTHDVLAIQLKLSPEAALRLLNAATALRLTRNHGGNRFGLGDLGAAMLGNPAVEDMVTHHAMLYRDLADPVALLRGTNAPSELSRYWPYAKTARWGKSCQIRWLLTQL